LLEQRNGRGTEVVGSNQLQVRRGTCETEGLQVLNPSSFGWRRLRDLDQRLRRLPIRYGRDDTVRRGIDRSHRIAILDPDVDA
jgi:hypothetical protein